MNNKQDHIKKWIKEAGREVPGMGFGHRVLSALESTPVNTRPYKPVISPLGIRIIIGGIAALFLGTIFLPGSAGADPSSGYALFYEQLHGWFSALSSAAPAPELNMPQWHIPFAGTGAILGWALVAFAVMMVLTGYIQRHSRHT